MKDLINYHGIPAKSDIEITFDVWLGARQCCFSLELLKVKDK